MLLTPEKTKISPQILAKSNPIQHSKTVAVVGLGYVGLPVAVAFGKFRPTIGYESQISQSRQWRHQSWTPQLRFTLY